MYANDDGDDGDGRDGDGGSDGDGNDAAAATNGNGVHEDYGGDSRMAIGRRRFDDDDGTTTMYVGDDGNGGDGGDGNGNSDGGGDGNGDDATATAVGDDVDEDNHGNLRTTIGQRQLDNDDGMTMMRWQWAAGNMQNACKCCAIHQSNNQLM